MPWSPPIAIKYAYWLGYYLAYKLKKWQIKGYEHTIESMNMYQVFEVVISDHRKLIRDREKGNETIRGKRGAKRTVKAIGGKVIDTFHDKVNLGDSANSPRIKTINKLLRSKRESK